MNSETTNRQIKNHPPQAEQLDVKNNNDQNNDNQNNNIKNNDSQTQYGKPITTTQTMQPIDNPPNAVINNQTSPVTIVNNFYDFKTAPISMICPVCKAFIITQVKKSFNCCSCLFCCASTFLAFGILFYIISQSSNGKQFCCCDATHRCPNCNTILGEYSNCNC